MVDFLRRIFISYRFIKRALFEFFLEMYFYYFNSYPLLRLIGVYKRIKRRLKYLWFPKGPGRPPVPENIVDLILDMKRCHPFWGKKRIRDELRFLGVFLDSKTIQKILKENGMIPPPMKLAPPPWKHLFYSNKKIWTMDFFHLVDFRCFQVYFLVVTDISTRKLVHLHLTLSPHKEWLIQQFRNIAIENIEFPEYLIIDNDGIYGKWIDVIFLEHFEIEILRIAKGKPWENGICERLIKTLKEEFLARSCPVSPKLTSFRGG